MSDYEANGRIDNVVRGLTDIETAIGEMSKAVDRNIEWSTSEITTSIDSLTEAIQELIEILTPAPRFSLFQTVKRWVTGALDRVSSPGW
jgi:hypothetical protein